MCAEVEFHLSLFEEQLEETLWEQRRDEEGFLPSALPLCQLSSNTILPHTKSFCWIFIIFTFFFPRLSFFLLTEVNEKVAETM